VEKFDIFNDIVQRTNGDIYIGVVGPVRTGKSTFIKRFMELLVLPNMEEGYEKEQAKDEMPQSGTGKTVMTTEPKFIPAEGVEITVNESLRMKVRLVDCVGYTVEGALGYSDEDGLRMVATPWFEEEIPFNEAAEIGTKKVISEHSTLGLVITTDGSITDIPRMNYVNPEERVVAELKELGKPFVIVLNTVNPLGESTAALAAEMEEKYDVAVIPINCQHMNVEDISAIMEQVLFEFPVKEVNINLPLWVEELGVKHWLYDNFAGAINTTAETIHRLRDVDNALCALDSYEFIADVVLRSMEMGSGIATIDLAAPDELYDKVLEEIAGEPIEGRHTMIRLMKELTAVQKEYTKVADGLREVYQTGYGMVPPRVEEMSFEIPELIKRGNQFGVKLKAHAPSLHFIKADIETEVTPIIGTERQCEELVKYILDEFEDNPEKLWQSNIFGKSLYDLVREGIQNKLFKMPENAQQKLQETLERIINESSGGLICIII
jgi:stage IV sporulation protein A